jgi:hypothetical protein
MQSSSGDESIHSAPEVTPLGALERMNKGMTSWVYTGDPVDTADDDADKSNPVRHARKFHLFPGSSSQSHFDSIYEESVDEEDFLMTPRPETFSTFDWRTNDPTAITPPARGPTDPHGSIFCQGALSQTHSPSLPQQESVPGTFSVPGTPPLNRTLSNLPIDAAHFRRHQDSVDLSRRRMVRFGALPPGPVVHRDSVELAKRRIKNSRRVTAPTTREGSMVETAPPDADG